MLNLVRKEMNGQPVFDVAFMATDDTSVAAQAAAATLIYATLFTDVLAPIGAVADGRRGWWSDPSAGSSLWYVRRQALGSSARAEAIDAVQSALIDRAPTLTDVRVLDVSPAGSVSAVVLEVTGKHNGLAFSIGLTL
jgi:phage gp46-like protein